MFGAALIVFRETLEAALFVGIIAAATRGLPGRSRWLAAGVAAGIAGALVLAALAGWIGQWADGIGQDLVNVGILSVALGMLLWHSVNSAASGREMAMGASKLGKSVGSADRPPWALTVAVGLAVLREGAETVLFIGGLATGNGTGATTTLLGSALGLGFGALTGLLMYAGLSRIPPKRVFAATNLLIALLAASIASQLARALSQAGLVERWVMPLWDSSGLLRVDSAFGAFLHALVGYDARPSGLQLAFYGATLVLIVFGSRAVQAGMARGTSPAPRPAG
jgi:high-affinity iron transporter